MRFTTYPAVAWVIALLGQLASAHVEELTFNVHNIINGKWVAELAELVIPLAQAHLHDVKSVIFRFRSVSLSANAAPSRESITAEMHKLFANLHNKEVLTIAFGGA